MLITTVAGAAVLLLVVGALKKALLAMTHWRSPIAGPLALFVGLATALGSAVAPADADGPDFYIVRGVAKNDVLNIRAEPDPRAHKVGEIPSHAGCVRNLGCRGGLTFEEFTTLSPAEKERRERENPLWCNIAYEGVTGWVNAHYLREGYCQSPPAAADLLGR